MTDAELDKAFEDAFRRASLMTQPLPPDIMLRIYAYYKKATNLVPQWDDQSNAQSELRNAFKFNAWLQVSNMTAKEAKKAYIKLIDSLESR